MISSDTSEPLFLSSSLLSSSYILPLFTGHCVHPNTITCRIVFLFLTHSLSLVSSVSLIQPPSTCTYWGKISLSSFAPFLSSAVFFSLSILPFPSHPLPNSLTSFQSFSSPCIIHIFPLSAFSRLLPSLSSPCLPNVILIMERVRVQPGSMN